MDINLVHSLWTVAALAVFLGIVWWAYAPSHRDRFERDGHLIFDETERPEVDREARQ